MKWPRISAAARDADSGRAGPRNGPLKAGLLGLFACGMLSGCGTLGISYDRTTIQPLDGSVMRRQPPCALRVCVQEPRYSSFAGTVQANRLANLRRFFASLQLTEAPTPALCDVFLKHDGPLIDTAELYSAYTGGFLARFKISHTAIGGAVCKFFAEGSEGFAKIPGSAVLAQRSAPARPPATAPPNAQELSAADIERIAKAVRGADVPAPPTPASRLPPHASPKFSSPERPDDLAVIVGIESYSDISSKAPYAERDAEAFKGYVRALGVPERNIVLLTGSKAVRSALTKNVEGWLPRMVKPDSRVYFYFSGHGAPEAKTGQAYLVPWDGDPNFLDATAYPVAQLYQKLGALAAKRVFVAMDSCFSGAGGRSVLASGARPLVSRIETGAIPAQLTVLAASAASEIAGSLDDRGHGAFTYFLLQGLDAGQTTPKALADYLTPRVQDEARRLNRDQTPQLQGDGSWALR